MKHKLLLLLSLTLLVAGCATTPVPTTAWRGGETRNYESEAAGLGWSQRYTASQGWADVYLYDLGQHWSETSDIGGHHGPFESAIRDIQSAEALGHYSSVKVVSRDTQVIEGLSFRHAVVTYKADGRRVESHVFVAPYEGKLLKIRVTFYHPPSELSRSSIAQIVRLHLEKLRKAQTA